MNGNVVDAHFKNEPLAVDTYYITPISARSARDFTKNPNALRFAP